MESNTIYKTLKSMYPALEESDWINADGEILIRRMSKQHIENTINMLENKSNVSLVRLKEMQCTLEEEGKTSNDLDKSIELLEEKIEEFKWYLNSGEYEKSY